VKRLSSFEVNEVDAFDDSKNSPSRNKIGVKDSFFKTHYVSSKFKLGPNSKIKLQTAYSSSRTGISLEALPLNKVNRPSSFG